MGSGELADWEVTRINSQFFLDDFLCDQDSFPSSLIDGNMRYSETLFTSTDSQDSWDYNQVNFPYNLLQNSNNIVGVALNGVFIMNGVNSDGLDGFYPKSYNSKPISYLDLDICYGTAE